MIKSNNAKELTLSKLFCDLCKVEDVVPEKCKVVFILESPHTTEVRDHYPAAGESGVDMTKVLRSGELITSEEDIALGQLIKTAIKAGEAFTFGIMNVCNYPLQFRALANYLRDSIKTKNRILNILDKKYIKPEFSEDDCRSVLQNIVSDFNERLSERTKVAGRIFIPCGKFARAFVEHFLSDNKSIKQNSFNIWPKNIPHPSYGHWISKSGEISAVCIEMVNELTTHLNAKSKPVI